MASVKYNYLESFLGSDQKDTLTGLFLIYGEPYLTKQAFDTLSAFLLGNAQRQFAIETLEGGFVSMGDIIEQVATFSFLVPKKIVTVKNIPLFQAIKGNQEVSFSESELDLFSDFIQKGIPQNHFLILTSEIIDKRKKIYKTINDHGLMIDCAVAKGPRKADVDEQRVVLKGIAAPIMHRAQKILENQAFHALVDLTGFNLDLFSQNLEKLIAYTGKNNTISISDVKAVIIRDKKDPIFNLTNAVMDKDLKNSLFYLDSLFNEGYHPLQILKTFENLIRKLIVVKCFTKTALQNNPVSFKNMNYNSFVKNVLPGIIVHDEQTKKAIKEQEDYLSKQDSKKKKELSNDLVLALNPKNPYPVFQVFQKSENFSLNELNHAVFFLSDLDYKMKSSSFDAKTQIENFIINVCSKGGFVYAEKNKNRRNHF